MLKIFDPDSLHDRLFAQKIDQGIINLVADAMGNHSFFVGGEPLPIAFLERSERQDWAVDWTRTVFEWLKPLSLTHLLTDPYLSGSAWGFEPEYQADLPEELDLKFPEKVTLTIPKGETVSISYFRRAHDVPSAPYCALLGNKISCWMLRFEVFNAPQAEDLEVELPLTEMLFNSLVLLGAGELDQGQDLLLYEKLPETLYKIWNQLQLTAPRILKEFEVIQPFALSVTEEWDEFAQRGFPTPVKLFSQEALTTDSGLRFVNPVFEFVPDWYFFVRLEIAQSPEAIERGDEQDLMGNPIVWRRIEEILFAEIGYTGAAQAAPALVTTDRGAVGEFIAEWGTNQMAPVWEGISPTLEVTPTPPHFATLAKPLIFSGIGEKIALPDEDWGRRSTEEPWEERQLFDGKNRGRVRIVYEEGTELWFLELLEGDVEYNAGAEISGENPTIRKLYRHNFWMINDFAFYRIFYDDFGYSIHGIYPPGLVKRTVNWFANNISRVNKRPQSAHWLQVRHKITYENQINDGINYQAIPIDIEQEEIGGVETNKPGVTLWEQGFTFSVEFWEEPPPVVPQFTEEEWLDLLYPEGFDDNGEPKEPFLLDPDPDNGDIMPDSKRIKEIHAALEAQRFANHSQSTEDNPKPTLRTLGRLIEAASYVLGVNFDEDGKNVAYPEPVLFDPEKIAEINEKKLLKNAQFAIAEINGGFDASSLYEVRSALLKKDRKEEYVDARPHAIKVHNLQQAMDALADDISKQLGGSTSAAFQVPSVNGIQVGSYAGITQAIADCLYMLSAHSANIDELQTQSLKTVWMLQQILKGLGLPYHVAELPVTSGFADDKGEYLEGVVPVPEIDAKSPTLTSLLGIVLLNLQRMVGTTVSFREETDTSEA